MAILKYQDKNGNIVAVNSYKINNVIVSQETGESTADVMSQKAVTEELNKKANSSDVYSKTETDNKLSTKANTSAIPTKVSQLTNDKGYLTSHQSLTDYAKKTEVTTADNQIKKTIEDNEAAITAALNKLRESSGFNSNGDYENADYNSLADAIDDLVNRIVEIENTDVIDCGVYAE